MYSPGSPSHGRHSPAEPAGNTVRDAWRPEGDGAPTHGEQPRNGVAKLLTGVGLAVLVVLLGEIAKTHAVTHAQLRVDTHIATDDRDAALTAFAKLMTMLGQPDVGLALMIVVPAILLVLRRRATAVRVFCVIAGALALTTVAKSLIDEHRPPKALWAMPPDTPQSFPSGHATTSTALAVALVIVVGAVAGTAAWRRVAVVVGAGFALLVACSRVYLGVHYPLDVTGGVLAGLSAGLVVAGLAALPAVHQRLARLDEGGGRRRAG